MLNRKRDLNRGSFHKWFIIYSRDYFHGICFPAHIALGEEGCGYLNNNKTLPESSMVDGSARRYRSRKVNGFFLLVG